MALGKYSRVDGRKSSTSYCSTVSFVVFIGLCLVGVWMMTSSSIVPVQNVGETTQEPKNEVQTQLKETSETGESNTSNESNTSENKTSNDSSSDIESKTSSDSNSNSESNRSSDSNSNSESNTSSDTNSNSERNSSESNTSSDGNSDSESNAISNSNSNSESKTDSDSKSNSESNTSNNSNSNSESNTSSDSNSNNESNTSSDDSNSNNERNASSDDTNSNNERNVSSDDINSNNESNTSSDDSNSNIGSSSNSESNTNSDITKSNTDSESTKSNTDSESTKSNTSSESTSWSSAGNESSKSNESQPKQFDDNPGDLPEDATKGDNITVSSNERNYSQPEKMSEHPLDDNQEKKPTKQSGEEDTNSDKGSGSESANEENKKEDLVSETVEKESKDGEKKPETDEKNPVDEKSYSGGQGDSKEDSKVTTSKSDEAEKKSEMSSEPKNASKTEDNIEDKNSVEIAGKNELLPTVAQSELLNETVTEDGAWKTQAAESKKEADKSSEPSRNTGPGWKLCNVTAGPDYIPCLDNMQAIRSLRNTKHYEHRERHCPDDPPTCLVTLPEGYQRSVEWPTSREKIWYHNVPHTKLAEVKGHQNWVKVSGEYLTFPGGGTQFKHGALHYIDFIQQIAPDIAWGKRSRVVLDVGCGVASFGGFLFDRDVLTMSFAPKDEHESQIQFALERGIPAFLAVMGTKRLPFPGKVFDIVHCARCRVPWHIEGGKLLLELNRLLRPGGFFVWSATPIYRKKGEDVQIWEAMKQLTKALCWKVISIGKDRLNGVGLAVFQKPSSNECYKTRLEKEPPMCNNSDDPNASWNVPLQVCMHKIPVGANERGSKWPEQWPARVEKPPYWLLSSQVGVYGKAAPDDFVADYEHWKRVVSKSYVTGMGINWSTVRNVMDMKAIYGGFAAALREMNVWVMNVVNVDSPDTLPIIYERGLFGMYHDWCESFNTYPRTYDLIHADHLFSKIKKKCNFEALVVEVDRILRPEGKLIVRDKVQIISELETMFMSMQWEVRMTYAKDKEGLLCVQKSIWRPKEAITLPYAIA